MPFAVLSVLAPDIAGAQQVATPPAPVYPQVVTSVDGYWQSGKFDTGNINTAHRFDARAYDVSLGVRLTDYLMISLRGQEAWTDVNLTLVPQSINVHSQSVGLRAVVNVEPLVWDTTVSYAVNDNSTNIPDPFGNAPLTAQWHGREWALDSSVSLSVPVGIFVLEPLGGVRLISLDDDGYTTGGFLPLTVPAQTRTSTSFRGQGKISLPIRLDQYGTLTPWVSGEVRHTSEAHPPIGSLTDLTGMAGGHYVFNLANLEGPGPFPGRTWTTASGGLRLDISDSYTLGATAVWSFNDAGSWRGYWLNAIVRF